MQAERFAVTYSHEPVDTDTASSDAKVILDQEGGWTELTGYMSEANFARYLGMLIYGEDFYAPLMDCGLDGLQLVTAILAYPVRNASFNVAASYGDIQFVSISFPEITTLISFRGSDSATTSFPINDVVSTTWLGKVYDLNDNTEYPPSVTYYGDNISLSKKVWGTLELVYKTKRHEYLLVVEPRENTESYETKFDTYVYATYNGGVTWLKVSEPPNADDLAGGSPCGYTRTIVNWGPAEDPLPYATPKDKLTEYDYCLLEEIDDGEGEV